MNKKKNKILKMDIIIIIIGIRRRERIIMRFHFYILYVLIVVLRRRLCVCVCVPISKYVMTYFVADFISFPPTCVSSLFWTKKNQIKMAWCSLPIKIIIKCRLFTRIEDSYHLYSWFTLQQLETHSSWVNRHLFIHQHRYCRYISPIQILTNDKKKMQKKIVIILIGNNT